MTQIYTQLVLDVYIFRPTYKTKKFILSFLIKDNHILYLFYIHIIHLHIYMHMCIQINILLYKGIFIYKTLSNAL